MRMMAERAARAGWYGFLALAIALTGALGRLVWALASSDFRFVYVVDTTTAESPLAYRVAALWGAMAGSLLFWIWLQALWAAIAVRRLRRDRSPLAGPTLAVLAAIVVFETIVAATMANPFETLAIPAISGGGLVSVLRHPLMVIHPPLLYVGLTTTIVPAAMILAAAMNHRTAGPSAVPELLARRLAPWLEVSWLALTVGMALGARWAYAEIGWGGFWAWDAVENTALLPWLAITAALHLRPRSMANDDPTRFGLLLGFVILANVSTAIGIVLTRSGVTSSVHAFAEAVNIGQALVALALVLTLAGCWATVRLTSPTALARPAHVPGPVDTRRMADRLNAGTLAVLWLIVATGTLWPALDRILTGTRSSTGPDFYRTLAGPVAAIGLFALAAIFLRVKLDAVSVSSVGVLVAVAAAIGAGLEIGAVGAIVLVGGVAALAALATALVRRSTTASVLLAHSGLALILLGAVGSAAGSEAEQWVTVGDTVTVPASLGGDLTLRLDAIETGEGDDHRFVRARFTEVGTSKTFEPEIRRFGQQRRPSAETALDDGILRDVAVVLTDVDIERNLDERARVTVFVRPLVGWVWVGVLAMTIGAVWTAATAAKTPSIKGSTTAPENLDYNDPARL